MKWMLIFVCSLAISSSLLSASEENDIERVLALSAKAMTAKELETFLDLWAENGEMITLAGGIYKGKLELKALLTETFNNPYQDARYELITHNIRFDSDNLASVDGIWKTYNAGPSSYPSCGIFLYQLVKESESWKIKLAYSSVPRQGHTAEHGRRISWVKECTSHKN